jgi:hypothetical protein
MGLDTGIQKTIKLCPRYCVGHLGANYRMGRLAEDLILVL